MNKCQECDSEISGQDLYCPFCGILLSPAVPPVSEEDESLESTIMMPPEEIARLAAEARLDVKAEATPEAEAQIEAEAIVAVADSDVSEEVGEPSYEELPPAGVDPEVNKTDAEELSFGELPEVPIPSILSDSANTSDNISARLTADYEKGQISESDEPLAEQAEAIEVEPERSEEQDFQAEDSQTPGSEDPIQNQEVTSAEADIQGAATELPENGGVSEDNPPSPENAQETEPAQDVFSEIVETEEAPVEEVIAVAALEEGETGAVEEEISSENKSSDEQVPELPALDEVASKGESAEEAASPVAEEKAEPDTVAAIQAPESKDPEPELDPDDASVEKQIVMPGEELEPHDPFAAGAMFDSVRIMENHEVPASEQPTIAGKFIDPKIYQQSSEKSEENLEKKETSGPVSNTAHNIGESDTDGKRSAKLKPLSEGTVLNGRYEVVRKIGGGGMGAVYLASDNNLGGVLRAVKEMVQSHIEDEQQEKAISDFKRESMILSTLDHPSIPTIFDYFYDENESRFYLVMKYISGGDLASRLRAAPEGRLDEKTVTEWAIQIADVLDYLHNQPSPIVYRDLKPSNIMVDGNSSRIMLIDFGIARSISQREEKGVTAVGTMGYAPPELFSGNVEPRSDIYSLGSTMFHLLTGADPQSNPLLIFDFQKNPRPRQINSQLSDQIERILMRCVEYTAQARFESAAELKSVLEDHFAALSSNALSYGVTEAPSSVSLDHQTVFCGFCGQKIVATDLFCAFCGAKQPIAQEGVHSGVYNRPATTAKLFVEGTGELSAPAFSLLKDENLVGRRDPMSNIFPEIDLSKYDPQTKISRRHARIWREGAGFLVEDLGSSNGTIVAVSGINTVRLIPHKPQSLQSGDKIKVGDTTLHFLVG